MKFLKSVLIPGACFFKNDPIYEAKYTFRILNASTWWHLISEKNCYALRPFIGVFFQLYNVSRALLY